MKKHNLIRLYCKQPIQQGAIVSLSENQAHYLKNVMRKNLSDNILIFNGKDGEWLAQIYDLQKKSGDVIAKEQTKQQTNNPDIWLCFSPIKNGKIEYLAQKATELGVSALQAIITERTIVNKVKEDKLAANVIEAAEQCERLSVPEILPAQKLSQLLNNWPSERNILLCDESGYGKPAYQALSTMKKGQPWAIFIGPEGGFSEDELAMLHKLPYITSIGLGPRILRADTAAIAALSCWQEHLGDWDIMPDFRYLEK